MITDKRHCADWRNIRHALGLTQHEMAELVCMSEREIKYIEAGHLAPPGPATVILATFLQAPEAQAKLFMAGVDSDCLLST